MTNTLASAALRLNQLFYERRPAGEARRLPAVLLMSDVSRLEDPGRVIPSLPPRVSGVILRHTDARRLETLARKLKPVCKDNNVRLLISNNIALHTEIDADGVHFAESHLAGRTEIAGARIRPDVLITAAAHSFDAVERAASAGVDACLVSPVFTTVSHPDKAPLGAGTFRTWCANSPVPLYALGGVTLQTVDAIMDSGAVGIAGIGGFTAQSALEP